MERFTNTERFVCAMLWPRFHPFNEGNDGKERDGGTSEGWVLMIWMIHLKEPVHKSHLCVNQAILVVRHVCFCTKPTNIQYKACFITSYLIRTQYVERILKMNVRICKDSLFWTKHHEVTLKSWGHMMNRMSSSLHIKSLSQSVDIQLYSTYGKRADDSKEKNKGECVEL